VSVLLPLLAVAATGYVAATWRCRRPWPLARTAAWLAGVAAAAVAVAGPLTVHGDLHAHMAGHLLVGMVAPLLLVLGAPVTLALRALPVPAARRLSRLLRAAPLRWLADPLVAVPLHAAGLWLLYGTGLHTPHSPGLSTVITAHLLLSGYLATASVLAVDPAPHRRGVGVRAGALAAGAAAHDVLAKVLYAHPPAGVTGAEEGARLMYDGGTVVTLLTAALLWRRWYVSREAVRAAARGTAQPAAAPVAA
jgi:putative membrane protein